MLYALLLVIVALIALGLWGRWLLGEGRDLRQQARDRLDRWRGLVTVPWLHAELQRMCANPTLLIIVPHARQLHAEALRIGAPEPPIVLALALDSAADDIAMLALESGPEQCATVCRHWIPCTALRPVGVRVDDPVSSVELVSCDGSRAWQLPVAPNWGLRASELAQHIESIRSDAPTSPAGPVLLR